MALLALTMPARGAPTTAPQPYELVPHADSAYAHELFHLQQIDLMKAEQARAAAGATADLWKAQLLMAQWEEVSKQQGTAAATQEYLIALRAYVKSQPRGLDGAWALDHAQFMLGKLAQPIITQMEYFGNNRRDREALLPLATAADEMLQLAGRSLDAAMKQLEDAKPFDDQAYRQCFAAAGDVRYYAAWDMYFRALALAPAPPPPADADGQRKKLLTQAANTLAEWAVDADNGVNYQAYLLRGKALCEAGDIDKALADLAKAQNEKAPNWVQYQARYQTVVANLRPGRDVTAAQRSLDDFLKWIPQNQPEAQISAEMLRFRVAWAVADSQGDAVDKRRGRQRALEAMAALLTRDERYRDLIYEQVALLIPEDAPLNTLLPLQQLALARTASVNQKGDTAESRRSLQRAAATAQAARDNTQATKPQQAEATFVLAVSEALLGNLAQAVKWEVEFATLAPQDPRARQVVDLALEQIGQLRSKKATTAAATTTAGGLSPELLALAQKALDLSTNTFGDRQWLYAQGRLLEESGKPAEAAAIYEKITGEERSFLEARYRLVALAAEKFGNLEGKGTSAEQAKAAEDLLAACGKFTDVLAHPPAATPKEVLDAARGYQYNIWLLEAATAVTPAVKNPTVALDRLAKLDAAKDKLTAAQQTAVLQYRMQAYLLAGQPAQATAALEEFVKAGGGGAGGGASLGVVRGMALATVDEIDKTTDPQEVKKLAGYVVILLNPLVRQATADGKSDNAFEYQLIQADMMVKAGQYKEAQTLTVKLQEQEERENKKDVRPYLADARAMFAEAQANVPADAKQYAKVQDYFTRILAKLSPGSETFWEAWLRIVQSMEAQAGANSRQEIKSRLGDLKAVYGTKFGGDHLAAEFKKLAEKYQVP